MAIEFVHAPPICRRSSRLLHQATIPAGDQYCGSCLGCIVLALQTQAGVEHIPLLESLKSTPPAEPTRGAPR